MDIKSQWYYLYYDGWTEAADRALVENIIGLKQAAGTMGNDIPNNFVVEAQRILDQENQGYWLFEEIKERLTFLKHRYDTIEKVRVYDGAWWDREDHYVVAKDVVWKKMIEENVMATMYYHKEEPLYDLLTTLYGETTPSDEGEVVDNTFDEGGPSNVPSTP